MARPDSLNDWPERVAAFVQATGESANSLAREAGVRPSALSGSGPMPNARTVLVIDALAAGHLLTPPEREWAHETIRQYNNYARQAGRPLTVTNPLVEAHLALSDTLGTIREARRALEAWAPPNQVDAILARAEQRIEDTNEPHPEGEQ